MIRKSSAATLGWCVCEDHIASIAREIEERGYSGPLALATDCTAVLPSICFGARFSCVITNVVGPVPMNTLQNIHNAAINGRKSWPLATKVRIYTVQIHTPNVLVFVVALLSAANEESDPKITGYHRQVLETCSESGMQVVSLSADGASEEQTAMQELENNPDFLRQDGVLVRSTFYGIDWVACNQKNACPLVCMGEAKHNKTNARNALQPGGRVLEICLGIASFDSVIEIFERRDENSTTSLRAKDVYRVDKQDDSAAYRTFESGTMQNSFLEGHDAFGVYLFVLDQLFDTTLSRHIG